MRRITLILFLIALMCICAHAEDGLRMREFVIGQGYKAQLQGSVSAADSIQVLVYNERTMGYDADFTVSASGSIKAANDRLLKIPMTSGEKQMIVLADGNEVYRAAFYVLGAPDDCKNYIKQCKLSANGDTSRMLDGSINSTLKIGPEGIKIRFPEDFGDGMLVLDWRHPPESFNIHYYDGALSETAVASVSDGFYVSCIPFGSDIAGIFVETSDKDGSLADMYVYKADAIPTPLQQWQPISEKLDILFVSTHQDDELLFFGGSIGYYSYAGKNTAVCYMADCGIKRYYEAMSGLWVLGLKNHPIFLGYKDFKADSLGEVQRTWAREGDPIADLVELYRRYRPDVVVCQDYNGEYGHMQHRYTAKIVTEAVKAAMDPAQYPDSYEEYGAWEVKKLYVHLYAENAIHIDWEALEVPGLGGINSLDLDKVAYNRHQSQLKDFSVEKQGKKYDCGAFGLVYSAVGADVLKNDFFENIGG